MYELNSMMKSSDMKTTPTTERIEPGTVPFVMSCGSLRYRSRLFNHSIPPDIAAASKLFLGGDVSN
jgi:hypothetical protein|tara:strand:+ start:1241 stop:1438 length:198 start_codon:yes stop_codon:yes gene_type:complete